MSSVRSARNSALTRATGKRRLLLCMLVLYRRHEKGGVTRPFRIQRGPIRPGLAPRRGRTRYPAPSRGSTRRSMPCSISQRARSGGPTDPAADADVLAGLVAGSALASSFFTAGLRSSNRWATMPESRSRPRVSWVRSLEPMEKPSKNLEELVGQQGVRRQFAHHDDLQSVLAALQAVPGQQLDHLARLAQGAHEGHHDLDVGQAHFVGPSSAHDTPARSSRGTTR